MPFSPSTIETAWTRSGGCCENCGKKLARDNHSEGQWGAWEAHHIKAEKDGGEDIPSNCKVLCLDCHKKTASYGSHD